MAENDYDALFIDVGSTLIEPRDGVARQYALMARATLGVEPPEHEIGARFMEAFERRRLESLARGELAYGTTEPEGKSFWRDVVYEVFSVWEDDRFRLETLFERLFVHFAHGESWTVYPDAHELLKASRNREIPIVVVSNWDARLPELLANTKLDRYFDAVVGSYAVGAEKPDPRIFEVALSHLPASFPRERVMHVGDRFEDDYQGATASGLQARHLDRGGRHEPHAHRIETLAELVI